MDIPIRGKRVCLIITIQRYRCISCQSVYQEDLPGMSSDYRMTNRLLDYIHRYMHKRTFLALADEIGITEGTVRRIFKQHEMNTHDEIVLPPVIGIDEIYLAKKPRCVISNIENRSVIEIIANRNKKNVRNHLSSCENPNDIRCVVMDMWRPYRDVAIECFPNAAVVVDKFHVVRMANDALENCRKDIRKNLPAKQRIDLKNDRLLLLKRAKDLSDRESMLVSYWKSKYPDLGKCHDLKERFYNIYGATDKDEAYDLYEQWENRLTQDVRDYFEPLIKAISNWHQEIFAYFDYRITNGYTESLNSVIRHIDRIGRGHGFETIRKKVLLGCRSGNGRAGKPKMVKKWIEDIEEGFFALWRINKIFLE